MIDWHHMEEVPDLVVPDSPKSDGLDEDSWASVPRMCQCIITILEEVLS